MEQMQIKATLGQAGVDYDKGLERFMGNVALYHKFLLKFLVDGSYADFVKELAVGDLVLAEKSVHTLKGTSGNLSLMRLFEAADATVQAIRTGQGSEEIKELAEKVGVGAVPGSAFFHEDINSYMRLHFAKNEDTLQAALERLSDIYKKIPRQTR